MKLRNKKTGEIVEVESCNSTTGTIGLFFAEGRECDRAYNSLAELNKEWEDYEEPKEYWWVDYDGKVKSFVDLYEWQDKMKEIGNYFETKEEAEKAVEKLKAWKRLKNKGFKITDWAVADDYELRLFAHYSRAGIKDELELLFGGEDD